MDLELQLRAAEARRADLERQHQEALSVLAGCGPDTLEARQSRVRELEKKIALENVRLVHLPYFYQKISTYHFFPGVRSYNWSYPQRAAPGVPHRRRYCLGWAPTMVGRSRTSPGRSLKVLRLKKLWQK